MTYLVRSRLAGALFLLAFVLYGAGTALAGQGAGTALVLLNSVAVAVLGALVAGALHPAAPRVAALYASTRGAEAILLAAGVLLPFASAYQVAMLVLGLGSIPACLALGRERLIPLWLARWGAAGYALLALGAVAELLGFRVGVLLAAPGGLFEIVLGVTLLARGFSAPVRARAIVAVDSGVRHVALVAGLGLLLMSVLAPLANFGVLERFVTVDQLRANRGAFDLAIAGLFAVIVLDVVVGWALWAFFDRTHRVVSLVAAGCRVVYAVVFGVAIANLTAAADLLRTTGAPPAEVLARVARFGEVWDLGLGLFGVHLLLTGWLAWRSPLVPRTVAALVAIAGAGYLADSVGPRLAAGYTVEVTLFTFVGEVVLMVWLFVVAARRTRGARSSAPVRPAAGAPAVAQPVG